MTTEALGGGSRGSGGTPSERLGPYRLVEQLGEGGMGIVHLALDPSGRAVALKLLRPSVAHDAQARARLSREVETLQRVRNPRVAPVLDADLVGDRPYVVTRYVPGPSLDEVVREHGPMDPAGLHALGVGLAEALEAIHAVEVIHRDLKPGNVLMADDGPVVIDFGIAHAADDVRITMTGLVMGTPGYLSPEVVEGAAVTVATDWWGWASTLAFAASGAPPFGRGPMDVVLSRVSRGDADLEAVDPRLAPLLYAALSPDPGARPHAGEVLDALERYAGGRQVTEALPAGWDAPRRTQPARPRPVPSTPPLPPPVGPLSPHVDAAPVAPPRPQPPPRQDPLPPPQGRAGEPWPGAWQTDEPWPDDDPVEVDTTGPGRPDPRIGLPMRSGSLVALLVLVVALTASWPVIGLTLMLVWSVAARAVDRSMTSMVVRRYHHGSRRSDLPTAVVSSPLHLVVAVLATVVSLLLPAVVAVSVLYTTALGLSALTGGTAEPDALLPLAAGTLTGVLVTWWGPGGTGLRRGSRSLLRGLTPGPRSRQVFVTGGLVLAAVALLVAASRGGTPSWVPWTTPPNPLGP